MDKKTPKSKQLKSAPKAGRVSMTDLVGVTKPAPAAQKPKAKAPQPTPTTKATPAAARTPGRVVRHVDPNDKVINVSAALRESEVAELQTYADEHSASRGSLITALMRYAMQDLRAGRIAPTVAGLKFMGPGE